MTDSYLVETLQAALLAVRPSANKLCWCSYTSEALRQGRHTSWCIQAQEALTLVASGTEAQRATTVQQGVVHDGPIGEAETPKAKLA